MRIDKEKAALWLFILVALVAFVYMAFPQNNEVEAVLKPEASELESTTYYNVPLDEPLQDHIRIVCDIYGMDMPLVLAVIGQESNYNIDITGDGGESVGLMQIKKKWHTARMDKLGVTDLSDPYQNVIVGIDLLAELIGKEKGREWALTAYNAGEAKADFNQEVGIIGEYAESVLMLREEIANEQ